MRTQTAKQLADFGFYVFPIKPNGKEPAFNGWQKDATRDHSQIDKWFAGTKYNIGITTSKFREKESLFVVDVDNKKGKDGFADLAKLEFLGCEFPETLTQITTTGGKHFIYKVSTPVKQGVRVFGDGIDTRAHGGFIVGPESEIDGKFYKIQKTNTKLTDLPIAPDWAIKKVGEVKAEPVNSKEKIKVSALGAVTRATEYIKTAQLAVEGTGGDHTTYRVAADLKDIGIDEGDCFTLMSDSWNDRCSPPWDLEELRVKVKHAYLYGKSAQGSGSPEADFKPIPTSDTPRPLNPIEELNKEYAFVTMGSGYRVLRESTDEDGIFSLDHLNEETFHKKLASRTIRTGDTTYKPLTKAWMASNIRRSYDGIVFSPGLEVPARFYNLWRGFSVKPLGVDEKPTDIMVEAVKKFEEHLFKNIVDSNLEHYEWVYGWFAHIIQKPWEKPGVALVMRGGKGVGKNVLFDSVGNLFYSNYMVTAHKRHLLGQFNSHMENLLLIVLNEAFWSGSKEEGGVLKDLITEPTTEIERKGVDSYKVKSRIRVAVVGNEDWVVPVSDDERRYAVFNVGEGRKQDTVFFTALREGMEAGGNRYLLTKLLNFDISKFNIRKAPVTDALHEQAIASFNPIQAWWYQCLTEGTIAESGFNDTGWPTEVNSEDLRSAFERFHSRQGIKSWLPSPVAFGKEMKKYTTQSRQSMSDRVRKRVYKLPPLNIARLNWDENMKRPEKWDS